MPGPPDERSPFGTRLHAERLRLGISQAEVAARCGLPVADLQAFEAGRLTLDPGTQRAVALSLGLDPERFVRDAEVIDLAARKPVRTPD